MGSWLKEAVALDECMSRISVAVGELPAGLGSVREDYESLRRTVANVAAMLELES